VIAVTTAGDYDFIVGIIEYLSSRHGIRFFISSGDFDLLYGWWEKGIPRNVMETAVDRVVARRRMRRLPVTAFAQFRYEVRRQHAAWLERGIGGPPVPAPESDPVGSFMESFPDELESLRPRFEAAAQCHRRGEDVNLDELRNELVELFKSDRELAVRVKAFMQNLSPELRRSTVERVYRANFLWSRFAIPDFAPVKENA